MFLALNLLFLLGAISYAVSGLVTETAFQIPLGALAHGKAEDILTLKSRKGATSTSTTGYSYKKTGGWSTVRHRQAYDHSYDTNPVITTVDGLRTKHGPRLFWWGDFDHVETRYVYHQLLPRHLLKEVQSLEKKRSSSHDHDPEVSVEELARLASMARHAARIYARERSSLPLRLLAGLYDGFRHLRSYGRWSWTGMTYEQIWDKYERQIRREIGEEAPEQEVNRRVALRILEKSCQTNKAFDKLGNVEKAHEILSRIQAQQSSSKSSKPWSSKQIKKALRPVTKTFESLLSTQLL